ncbi:hypothetical protein [Gorillibacterium timonense]|uniref:hypothetical protein n=1 Tax=Gorillibacterium timonense TaxID=1689269 RepID=UPI00071CFB53|nr:hypothetical protein [Gorillibacterium timonense]
MNRYYYIALIKTMSMNIILFVPHILIEQRFTGAIPSMLLSLPLSMLLLYGFTRTLKLFPEQGAPEILAGYLPPWFLKPYLVLYGIMIFNAGTFVIIAYSTIVTRFIFPDMSYLLVVFAFCLVTALGATRSTSSVIAFSEIMLLLNIPLIIIILTKAMGSADLKLDAIRTMSDYLMTKPAWFSLGAATYVFSGYTSIGITNRLQPSMKGKRVRYGFIALVGMSVLLITFLVPIGLHGTIGVNNYAFVWISTSDMLRMPYGVIERVLFLFLFLNFNLSLMFIAFVWHIGCELIKSGLLKAKPDPRRNTAIGASWIIVGLFIVVTVLFAYFLTFRDSLSILRIWFLVRLGAEILLVLFMVMAARKVRSS